MKKKFMINNLAADSLSTLVKIFLSLPVKQISFFYLQISFAHMLIMYYFVRFSAFRVLQKKTLNRRQMDSSFLCYSFENR